MALRETSIEQVFEQGLHEFLLQFISDIARIDSAIAADYRFVE